MEETRYSSRKQSRTNSKPHGQRSLLKVGDRRKGTAWGKFGASLGIIEKAP